MLIDIKPIDLEKTFGKVDQKGVLLGEVFELFEAMGEGCLAHKLEEICDVIQATVSYAESEGISISEIKFFMENLHYKKLLNRDTVFKEER